MTLPLSENILSVSADGVLIRLHLQPRASRTELCGIHGDELKVRVTSPPVDDAANKLCLEFFAKLFGRPKTAVSIVSGNKSRHKKLLISGITVAEAADLLRAPLLKTHPIH